MMRWLILSLLLITSAGCALFDDFDYDPSPYGATAPTQNNGCAAPVIVNSNQTQEPETLR